MRKIECEKHPKYEGKGKPTSQCLNCWKIHVERKNEEIKGLRQEFESVRGTLESLSHLLSIATYLPRTKP